MLCRFLKRLRYAVFGNWAELWWNQSWTTHHDNAPAHTSLFVSAFLVEIVIALVSQQTLLFRWGSEKVTKSHFKRAQTTTNFTRNWESITKEAFETGRNVGNDVWRAKENTRQTRTTFTYWNKVVIPTVSFLTQISIDHLE